MGHHQLNRSLRTTAIIVLSFFIWTFGGVFDVAFAIKDSSQLSEREAIGTQQKKDRPVATGDSFSPANPPERGPKREASIEKALERISVAGEKAHAKLTRGEDADTEEQDIHSQKAEIDKADVEIKKQFRETEEKIKDLPEAIKQRHRDFVKKYDTNLKELSDNLDSIKKAKTKQEKAEAHNKNQSFLEKIKPPKKHKPLDPNKLPHETVDPVKPARIEAKATSKTQERISETLSDIYNATIDFLFPSAYAADISATERAANLAETIETPLTPEIEAFANELGDIPIDIFVPVRDGFKYEPYAGSVKGAVQTLREKSGNEWDLASLLIALLRAKGIPARYTVGTIQMPIDQAMEWLGVEDPNMAATLLYPTAGQPL